MAKRYLATDLFEPMVCSAAQLHLRNGQPLEELAQLYWDGYKVTCIDDGVVADIIRAASEGIALLTQANAPQLDSFFHQLKWYTSCFGPDGCYIRRGLLDGMWLRKPPQKEPERVAHFLDKLKRYYVGLTLGLRWYPPAPDGWSLKSRKMWNPEVARLTSFRIPSNSKEANPVEFPTPSRACRRDAGPTLREMLLNDFGHDLPIAGGFGGSKDDPIVILPEAGSDYVKVEYTILQCLGVARQVEWKLVQQALSMYEGKQLDQMKIETKETTEKEIITTTTNYYFDVSACIAR